MSIQKQKAEALVLSLVTGHVDPSLLTDDCVCWAPGGNSFTGETLCMMVGVLASLFEDDFTMTIDSIIEEGERVAVISHSRGTLTDGIVYENEYHYALIFRDEKICEMREYMNSAIVDELIRPRIQAAMIASASESSQ